MTKFQFTKSIKSKGLKFSKLKYGTWAIQSITYGILSSKHVLSLKQYIQQSIKKVKQCKFTITVNKIATKKPLDSRMGGGKGSIYDRQYFLKPGSIVIEFYNISSDIILPISKIISNKISIKVKLLKIN